MGEDKRVLQLGGLGSLLAGVLLILTNVVLAVILPQTADPEVLIMRFPDVRAVSTAVLGLNLVALILEVALFLALYRALRRTSLASALYGSVLGVLGLVVLALAVTSALVAFVPLSDLYHAPGATPEEQATVVLMFQAAQGIVFTFFGVGWLLVPIGIMALGVAMLGATAFGKAFGGVSVVLGVAGVAGLAWAVVGIGVGSVSLGAPVTIVVPVIANLIFLFLLGGKVYSLSRAA